MVGADADGAAEALALLDQWRERLLDVLELRVVLLLRLVRVRLELLGAIREVSGVDADFSKASATIIATRGLKWMSATRGVSYPSWKSLLRIFMHASASRFPCTVMRTMSAPASAHRIT